MIQDIFENIPAELRIRPQWVPWRFEQKPNDKAPRKMPKLWNAKGNAQPNNPDTWTTFENAMQSYKARAYDGVAYMLADDDPYTMFDLDDCIVDSGKISDSAQVVIDRFGTYSEISISGKGVKGIARGKFSGKGKKVGDEETYCRGRMFCFTGNHLPGTPKMINANQDAIDWFYAKLSKAKTCEPHTASGNVPADADQDALAERCWKYLEKLPDAISGDDGHGKTFHAACECFRFGLDDEHATELMRRFNDEKTGGELWSDEDLTHKLEDARREVESAGEIGSRIAGAVDRHNPLPIARQFIASKFAHAEHPTLIFNDGDFHHHNGTHWQIIEPVALRQKLYNHLEPLKVSAKRGDLIDLLPFKPTSHDVDTVTDALRAVAYQPVKSPAWLVGGDKLPDPSQLIVATNGVFTLNDGGAQKLCDPTPRLFTMNALDYALMFNAPTAARWLAFLADIFDDDQQQIDLLQEWFGYVLTADTRQQKMLLLIGPPRSGKGTIARVLSRVIGLANVCAPTLAGLGTNFGLWPLIGKLLAIISDARLSGRSDQAIVTERLLSISGEDALTIDRKNRELLTTKLSTRIMLLSNELPRLADASGALSNRFAILTLRKSYLGEEDTRLTDRLVAEVPSIAVWALQGLERLRDEGRFTEPSAGDDMRQELNDLASPISAFLRDCCRVARGQQVECAKIYAAWCAWCEDQGTKHAGNQQVFGRDLRAALAGIASRQMRDGDLRTRVYIGIGLTLASAESGQKWRLARGGTRAIPLHVGEEPSF